MIQRGADKSQLKSQAASKDYIARYSNYFKPILDNFSTPKQHQKHVENNMQKRFQKGTPLDVSGALFNIHFCSKCQVFSERFSSIELEHAFYAFRSFFEPLDPQKTLYLCSKTKYSRCANACSKHKCIHVSRDVGSTQKYL